MYKVNLIFMILEGVLLIWAVGIILKQGDEIAALKKSREYLHREILNQDETLLKSKIIKNKFTLTNS